MMAFWFLQASCAHAQNTWTFNTDTCGPAVNAYGRVFLICISWIIIIKTTKGNILFNSLFSMNAHGRSFFLLSQIVYSFQIALFSVKFLKILLCLYRSCGRQVKTEMSVYDRTIRVWRPHPPLVIRQTRITIQGKWGVGTLQLWTTRTILMTTKLNTHVSQQNIAFGKYYSLSQACLQIFGLRTLWEQRLWFTRDRKVEGNHSRCSQRVLNPNICKHASDKRFVSCI
jgi:hypothetical protein